MNLSKAAIRMLHQLSDLIYAIHSVDFSRPSKALGDATIGAHIRHSLEFFLRLEAGCQSGVVNYDKREHSKLIESDKNEAQRVAQHIIRFIQSLPELLALRLEAGFDDDGNPTEWIDTNVRRELIYNIEHTLHHMALIRIGLRDVAPYVSVDEDFGVARSTARYRKLANSAS